MPITILDLILLGVMLISGLLAMVRGFMREILSIAAWGAAALVTLYAFSKLLPTAKPIQQRQRRQRRGGRRFFIGTLIVVSIITVRILRHDSWIRGSARSTVPSGFLVRPRRGLLIVVVAFLFFQLAGPDKQRPDWVNGAKSRTVLDGTGAWLMSLLPDDPENTILKRFKKNKPDEETTDNRAGYGRAPVDGYSKPARDQLQEADRWQAVGR